MSLTSERRVLHTVQTSGQYGPIHADFHFDLLSGYTALFGANNAGKSALLQLIFRSVMGIEGFGPDGVCFVLPDRQPLSSSNETAGRTLTGYNNDLLAQLNSGPLPYQVPQGGRNDLGTLLVHHKEGYTQFGEVRDVLVRLGLPRVDLGERQTLRFEDIDGFVQGSGLRALYPIAAALTDPRLRLLLIDEPEISLEPTLQKALRDLLIEWASEQNAVVVASHSHLFVDRADLPANRVIRRITGGIEVEAIQSEDALLDLVFKLLGNSTEDLFFPGNYLVAEGGSDQTIVEMALVLLGAKPGQVKVVSASGVTSVRGIVEAVKHALLPLIFGDSPYHERVVALIDSPTEDQRSHADAIRQVLGERLVELPAESLEEYLPEQLYEAAGLDKAEEVLRVRHAQGKSQKEAVKTEIAKGVAAVLDRDLLDLIPEIRDAADRALSAARQGV
jgi:ABC-type phosphonate transport system ATPase subunit